MAAQQQPMIPPEPYATEEGEPPPPDVVKLWMDVGNGIEKSQQVVWKKAVDSLDTANTYLRTSKDSRFFTEKYMSSIIGILVEQQPAKIGTHERTCVQESLALAAMIVANDLEVQVETRKGQSILLDALGLAFNKKKAFYKGAKGNWNVSHMQGLPEVRLKTVERFRMKGGFSLLNRYLLQTNGTPFFPKLDTLNHILIAVYDAMILPRTVPPGTDPLVATTQVEDDALLVADATVNFINSSNEETLKKISSEMLSEIQSNLQKIYDRLVATRRSKTYEFYAFWRVLALKLIQSQSLPLKLFGWSQVDELIEASAAHRPPPKSFVVTQAGCAFVNGVYEYAGAVTDDGYSRPGAEISYVYKIQDGEEPGSGKKLTLFRCTMRSQQKWWFLSEADEEQPGTDRDIDYYQHKSKEHEEAFPPPDGWFTCRSAGLDPPPHLEPKGLLVPAGQEFETLDHQLAKWAIENEIVEQVLGDTTIHREVVARSTVLIKFLAGMCDRHPSTSETMTDRPEQKKYCLQASHLLFAWKTCLRKADAAVSSQVYFLLVSILPLCPVDLAIPLLKAVQKSLHETDEKRDYQFEVSEFCSALAAGNLVDNKSGNVPVLKDEVREEALNLMWSVLTQCDASSLRTYDALKHYVDLELRVEPKGSEHREKFMRYCIVALTDNAKADVAVEEVNALRMVRLTHFVIDACPREQADRIVSNDSGALPRLLFEDLRAYLLRRKNVAGSGFVRKSYNSTMGATPESDSKQHLDALTQRLKILRHMYGLTDLRAAPNASGVMTYQMIETLWQLCDAPDDRAALMVFIASASHCGRISFDTPMTTPHVSPPPSDQLLSAAFDDGVCQSVFLNLFCSPSCTYDQLGDGAYKSFHFLFNTYRINPTCSQETKNAGLDALWRICLMVEKDRVASQARMDLLNVYISAPSLSVNENGQPNVPEQMVTDDRDDHGFIDRILDCLSRVKVELDAGTASAFRSADRCLRILNAAIGQNTQDAHSMTSSTLIRLSLVDSNANLENIFRCLPHGMRGQSAYRRVGIVAKRPNVQTGQKEAVPAPSRLPSRFPLDLHPLETLASVKSKVALVCQCAPTAVKPIQVSGRAHSGVRPDGSHFNLNLNLMPEDIVVDELGVVEGCEIVFVIAERAMPNNAPLPPPNTRSVYSNDLSAVFYHNDGKFADRLFNMLLGMLKSLPWKRFDDMVDSDEAVSLDTHKLAWDFLLAMPTNPSIELRVKSAPSRSSDEPSVASEDDPMDVDSSAETWNQLLDLQNFDRSVYVLKTIDSLLRPAKEVISILPEQKREPLQHRMDQEASAFRRLFIEAGGFAAVVRFFSAKESGDDARRGRTRRGNAFALRILKACLFGNVGFAHNGAEDVSPDDIGSRLLDSLSDAEDLLSSLISMVVDDPGISSSTITDVLRFLRLLLQSSVAAQSFVSLPNGLAERFLAIPLMHDEDPENTRSSAVSAALVVRRSAHDLILQTSVLADSALPWLVKSIDKIDLASESTNEYFDVLEKLVGDGRSTARSGAATETELRELGTMVCKKLASCPRPVSESESSDCSTGVLCGCLKLLRALIENGGSSALQPGAEILLAETGVDRWSTMLAQPENSALPSVSSASVHPGDEVLIDLMGCIFDGFLSPGGSSSVSICCDKESRRKGFDVIAAVARSCNGKEGYIALVNRISGLVSSATPHLRHRWGQFGGGSSDTSPRSRGSSKYSGLRNQGCTCYMNSVLQQLFMMPELRHSMCSSPVPTTLRTSGGTVTKGFEIKGRRISLQWENGVSYDADVEDYDESTGMHRIRYCATQVATAGGPQGHQQIEADEIARLPPQLPDEFILSEGRPGKETGVFEIAKTSFETAGEGVVMEDTSATPGNLQETQDESASRHLLEEVQRTFIHLDEGSRGRCFDPRALVEACACLKLEFDVWQQNDASEFTTKLLDRVEIALKKYAPSHFRYLDHTFGIKVTKQKICKECGLKTNREEKHINIDCQIRGKTDIHEALAAMTEDEIMEGSNRVSCDICKKNTDTILRTAISTLPNMLILSLKRFDLDFNTFETVKLNSRCAFGETLNLKPYTLEGLEAVEKAQASGSGDVEKAQASGSGDPSPMETDDENQRSSSVQPQVDTLANDDYEYRLVGVLVHAGVAQGGHYYSFIKDRNPGSEGKWYRFDDEDVTPFDPASIESECFGGKVKKETKWPNGQVHTVEQEQFANALILFYEKVKPTDLPPEEVKEQDEEPSTVELTSSGTSSGYDVFKADVQRSNATHRWQSFLFDPELQSFMKGLLGLCGLSADQPNPTTSGGSWRQAVMQMLLSFVFDVLLYSSDRSFLGDWSRMLEEALLLDPLSGRATVLRLARKTQEVSSNWLRTFLLDCPDQGSRSASILVFAAAMKSCLSWDQELEALERWCVAWEDQVKSMPLDAPAPCCLGGQWSAYEDLSKLDREGSSSVGVIISYLNVLLEAMPRCWRFSPELCSFIRHLATLRLEKPEYGLRRALVVALSPCRLVALVSRDRLYPTHYRALFPGTSLSMEAANTQMRPETSHNQVMSMNNNHLPSSDANSQRLSSPSDYATLLEALACIAGLPGSSYIHLIHDSGEVTRSRRRYVLSAEATQALTSIFHECCYGAPGMGQREIESYLQRSGVDASQVSSQKIMDMLSKYPTTTGSGVAAGPKFLSLEGFLAYYRDTIQNNDLRLRHDLHIFGFRPDLTRRSQTARFVRTGDRMTIVEPAESVALDVAELLGVHSATFGSIADQCLANTVHVYITAFNVSEPLALYLVAGAAYMKPCDDLIDRILQAIFLCHNDWSGNEAVAFSSLALQVIATLPGPDRDIRIKRIMESTTPASRHHQDHYGVGLLPVLRYLHHTRQTQHYNNDLHWTYTRYVEVVKTLRKVHSIFTWMNENRASWGMIERDLLESSRQQQQILSSSQQQLHAHSTIRGDFGDGTNARDGVTIPLDHHGHSDSDLAGMNDSEDDEDSQFELPDHNMETTVNEGPYQITVDGAGNQAVNGTYVQNGYFQDACRYMMEGRWTGKQHRFYIFQCNVSNNTKHWYISIVPNGSQPGTSSDIDFYTAPVNDECRNIPPRQGWVKALVGDETPPVLDYINKPEEETNGPEGEGIWNDAIEDENQENPSSSYV